jgi:carbon storage regulator
MLVLTRKSNQSIMIGDDIEVSVLSIIGEKVRIGIQAPREVPVFRNEVYLEIQGERGIVVVPEPDVAHVGHDAPDAPDARAEVDEALLELADGSAE